MTKKKTITIKESDRRKRDASIFDSYDGPCECCGEDKDTSQDTDYAWVCNACYWTRIDNVNLCRSRKNIIDNPSGASGKEKQE